MDGEIQNQLLEFISNGKDTATDLITDLPIEEVGEIIPGIKNVIALKNTILNIKKQRLERNIKYFLLKINEIPQDKRHKFVQEELEGNKEKFIDALLKVISKLDEEKKVEYLIKAYTALVFDKISFDIFFRIISIIDTAYIEDLNQLVQNQTDEYKGLFAYTLSFLGVTIRQNTYADLAGKSTIDDMNHHLTPLGEILKSVLK